MIVVRTRQIHRIAAALLLLAFYSGSLWASSSESGGGTAHTYPTSKAEDHDFVLVSHYYFTERDYQPQVVLPRVSQLPAETQSPEEVLISQFSALDALDFDWWLKTWDGPSAQKIQDRMTAEQKKEAEWRKQWQAQAGKMRVVLTRWLLSGDYVVLVYRIEPVVEQKEASTAVKGVKHAKIENSPEVASVFHLWNGTWHATLDLENDPVVLHFADTNAAYEWTVRPGGPLKDSVKRLPSAVKASPQNAEVNGGTKSER